MAEQQNAQKWLKQAEEDFNMAYVMLPEDGAGAMIGGLFRRSAHLYLKAYLVQEAGLSEDALDDSLDDLLETWELCVEHDADFNNILEGIHVLQRFPAGDLDRDGQTDSYYIFNKDDLIQAREATGDISLFVNHKLK